MWQNYSFQVAAAKNENKNRYQKHMRHINKTHVTVSFLNDHICLQNELQPGRTHIYLIKPFYNHHRSIPTNHHHYHPIKKQQTNKITHIPMDHISQEKDHPSYTPED